MHGDAHALVALALRFDLGDLHATDLACRPHVGATVGLLVETDDVDDADLGDVSGIRLTFVRMRSSSVSAIARPRRETAMR